MDTLLFESVSAITAMIVFVVWLRPKTFDFLKDKDTMYPSLGRQGQFTAMIVSTWIIVVAAIKGAVNEWLFTGYMFAWAGAQFGSVWLKLKGQNGHDQPKAQETKTP